MPYKTSPTPIFSPELVDRFDRVIAEGLSVGSHNELLAWLRGEIQLFLPHEILIAAWGDFSSIPISYDIVSGLAGVRTAYANPETLSTLLQGLFVRWTESGKWPYTLGIGEAGFQLEESGAQHQLGKALKSMRTLLVHGLTDERANHDCLYVIFSAERKLHESLDAMQILLPYLDAAYCRVTPLPLVRPMHNGTALEGQRLQHEQPALSKRELEIMHWVKMGKTNPEIASILGISVFTVKNHLQRVFKILDVTNRMQAASKMAGSLKQKN